MDLKFCYIDCKYLTITEDEQKLAPHVDHYCKRYNKKVVHGGFHPDLLRVTGCDYQISKGKEKPIPISNLPQGNKCGDCRFDKRNKCAIKGKYQPETCHSHAPIRHAPKKVLG